MTILHDMVTQMAHEGIVSVSDLVEFDKTSLQQIADNLHKPGGRIPNHLGQRQDIPYQLCHSRLTPSPKHAYKWHAIRFYETIGRPLTAPNLHWSPIMRKFGLLLESLRQRRDADNPVTPKISK